MKFVTLAMIAAHARRSPFTIGQALKASGISVHRLPGVPGGRVGLRDANKLIRWRWPHLPAMTLPAASAAAPAPPRSEPGLHGHRAPHYDRTHVSIAALCRHVGCTLQTMYPALKTWRIRVAKFPGVKGGRISLPEANRLIAAHWPALPPIGLPARPGP